MAPPMTPPRSLSKEGPLRSRPDKLSSTEERLQGLRRLCSIRAYLPLHVQTRTSDTALVLSKPAHGPQSLVEGAGLSPFDMEHHFHKALAAYLGNTYPIVEAVLPNCHRCSASEPEKSRSSERIRTYSGSSLSLSHRPTSKDKKPASLEELCYMRMVRAKQEGTVPALHPLFIQDLVAKFGLRVPCADSGSQMSHHNRFARIYLGHREKRPLQDWYKPGGDDCTPIDDTSNVDPLGSFSLTVDKLEMMTEWKWASPLHYVRVMAHILAVSHWSILCDGSNIGFAIGGPSPPRYGADPATDDPLLDDDEDLDMREPQLNVLPAAPFRRISIDEKGVSVCVKAFMTNKKPYFPRPHMKHVSDSAVWESFKIEYLRQSRKFLKGQELELAHAFLTRVEEEERKRLAADIAIGEMVVVKQRSWFLDKATGRKS